MERIVWLSIFLILVVSCQGLDVSISKAHLPALKNQKLNGRITPGMSQHLPNSIQQLISQAFNDLENRIKDKLSQVLTDLNDKIDSLDTKTETRLKDLDSKTETRFAVLQNDLKYKIDLLENRMDDSFKSTDEKIVYLQATSNTMYASFDSKLDDRLGKRQNICGNKSDVFETKVDQQLGHLQSGLNAKFDAFENHVDDRLDTLQDSLQRTLDNKTISSSKKLLDDQTPKRLADCSSNVKTDILNYSVGTLVHRTEQVQRTLENFSEKVENTLNKTLDFLSNFENEFNSCSMHGGSNLNNQTEAILDVLTSWGNSTQCLSKDPSVPVMDSTISTCHRGMGYDATKTYQPLEIMRDKTLNRDILCDTQTVGGGWIVIQRRTNGDVDFYKTWDEYRNGFGSPPGDFWLGNEAIHDLTSKDSYELRIDFNDGSQDLFAVYSMFRIENESDNYRLRLGIHSGTLGEKDSNTGLSYNNGCQFSTYDKDNDDIINGNCAMTWHGAWWYKKCHTSNLNGKWIEKSGDGLRWFEGSTYYYASSTEMKIRRI